MSDLHEALNDLARRGEPRGFDHVLAAAASAAEHAGEVDGEDADRAPDTEASGDLDPIPFVTTEPGARRRRPFASMVAAAGVAALVLVGAFAVSAVVGGGGGSSSAEGAVRRLADAISHEDPLAAADVLAPNEVRSLHGTLDAAAKKAQELQLVQTAAAPLAGVDFNVDNLKLSTESLGDGYAKVTVDSGSFTASTQKARFSALMQKVLRNSADNHAQSDLSKLEAGNGLPTFVVAVRDEGNWYVSAAYTVLEYVREMQQLPAADFGSGEHDVATLGADSPDAAVQDAMRALQRSDWSKLMTFVSPNEIPFYDYRAAFTELIRRSNENSGGPQVNFTIDAMTTNAQVNGDTAKVTLQASGKTDSGSWSLDGGCFTPPGGRVVAYSCRGNPVFLGLLATPLSGLDKSSQVDLVKRGGRWFVSPVGTVLDVVDRFVSQLDRRSLYSLLGVPNQLPPDGRLTLGQPVTLNAANGGMQVLTFAGHKGESIIGVAKAASGSSKPASEFAASVVRVFAADGSEIGSGCCLLDGQPFVLPAAGTYTVVVQSFGFSPGDTAVTIWDTADAPPGTATQPPGSGSATCTPTPLGGESCRSVTAIAPGGVVKESGQVGGGSFSVGSMGPASTVAVPTSVNRSDSVSSSGTSSVPHG